MRNIRAVICAALVAAALAAGSPGALARNTPRAVQAATAAVFPGAEWERVADLRAAGYCQAGLDRASARARGLATTGAMAVVGGRVLWDYGDLQAVSYLASVRKSILAMLYGRHVEAGTISLSATLADLKIDDVQGLLPREKEATVHDLLASRSGVYEIHQVE